MTESAVPESAGTESAGTESAGTDGAGTDGAGTESAVPGWRRTAVIYSALRFVVFLGVAGALALVGFNGYPLLLLALLISSIASLVVLKPQREALTAAQVARREQRTGERDERRARLESS